MSSQLLDWEGNGDNMISEGSPVHPDMVNHPEHYNKQGIEVIDVIEAYHPNNYHLANALKYLCRAPYKGHEKEDLLKCVWYINRYLENYEDTVPAVPREQGDK